MVLQRSQSTVVLLNTQDEEPRQPLQHYLISHFTSSYPHLRQGLVDGVTGVVVRPLQGAQQSGAPGFMKGLGQGAIGLVVRPVGGVVDFTYGLLTSVKRFLKYIDSTCKANYTYIVNLGLHLYSLALFLSRLFCFACATKCTLTLRNGLALVRMLRETRKL